MAGIENGHIVFFRHGVHRSEQGAEILFRVDVLLPVGRKQNVFPLGQSQPLMYVRRFNGRQVGMEYLRHGRAGDVHPLFRQAALVKILPGVLRVGQIHIGDDVHNPAVGLLGQALILAPVARLHVENGNVQPLGGDGRQAGVGVPQNQHRIGLDGVHQLVGTVDDVAHGSAQVVSHRVQVHIRVGKAQVPEENPVQVIIIILSRVGQNAVEILPALGNHRRQADNLRPGSHQNQQFQFAVVPEGNVGIVQFDGHDSTAS